MMRPIIHPSKACGDSKDVYPIRCCDECDGSIDTAAIIIVIEDDTTTSRSSVPTIIGARTRHGQCQDTTKDHTTGRIPRRKTFKDRIAGGGEIRNIRKVACHFV